MESGSTYYSTRQGLQGAHGTSFHAGVVGGIRKEFIEAQSCSEEVQRSKGLSKPPASGQDLHGDTLKLTQSEGASRSLKGSFSRCLAFKNATVIPDDDCDGADGMTRQGSMTLFFDCPESDDEKESEQDEEETAEEDAVMCKGPAFSNSKHEEVLGSPGKVLKQMILQPKRMYQQLQGMLQPKSVEASEGEYDEIPEGPGEAEASPQPCNKPARRFLHVKDLLGGIQFPKKSSDFAASGSSSSKEGNSGNLNSLALAGRGTLYTEAQLKDATQEFSEANLLGQGAFGAVYRGDIHGTPVAIKRLYITNLEASGFKTELDVLSRIRHRNIVLLMGFCPGAERPCLVYEFLSGGNLQQRLECKYGFKPLPWIHRIRISSDLSSALLFLHSQETPILHRDLKPENVMLDEDGRCKIVDVGMARMNGNSQAFTKVAVGTIGYIDPELLNTGRVTRASDVYSLGLILVHVLTGVVTVKGVTDLLQQVRMEATKKCKEQQRREEDGAQAPAKDEQEEGTDAVGEHLRPTYNEMVLEAANILAEKVDASAGQWPPDIAKKLACVAMRCSSNTSRRRPKMRSVHSALSALKEVAQARAL